MAILRNKTQGQYVVVQMTMVKDKNLKLTDRGLLLTLLSLPDNWNLSIRGLAKILPDGKSAIDASMKRLEEFGYITRYQDRSTSGMFGSTVLEIHETPIRQSKEEDTDTHSEEVVQKSNRRDNYADDDFGEKTLSDFKIAGRPGIGQHVSGNSVDIAELLPENKGISPCPENQDTDSTLSDYPCPENREPVYRDPEKRCPENQVQSINNKSINQKVNIQECVSTLDAESYGALVYEFGQSQVEYQIQKINARGYKNCMNYETIRAWCQEARDRSETVKTSETPKNRFLNFEQRKYDFDKLEQQIMRAQGER